MQPAQAVRQRLKVRITFNGKTLGQRAVFQELEAGSIGAVVKGSQAVTVFIRNKERVRDMRVVRGFFRQALLEYLLTVVEQNQCRRLFDTVQRAVLQNQIHIRRKNFDRGKTVAFDFIRF